MAPVYCNIEEKQYKSLKKAVDHLKGASEFGLNFVRLYVSLVRIYVFSDASCANAPRIKRQLGFIVLIVDNHNHAKIVHYRLGR